MTMDDGGRADDERMHDDGRMTDDGPMTDDGRMTDDGLRVRQWVWGQSVGLELVNGFEIIHSVWG
jgi:hypothetical protein